MTELKTLLAPISEFVRDLDLTESAKAEAELNRKFPPTSAMVEQIRSAAVAALAAGTICQKEAGGIKFSRVAKPEQDPGQCSIDAVWMSDSQGPVHTHTKGEVCLCIARSGKPAFDDRSETWVVMPKGSRHRPTVRGGEMLILYWWPDGAVEWK